MSDRTDRIQELRLKVGTVLETPMTLQRVAEYESMTDEQYTTHMDRARSAAVSRMAGELFGRRR